MPRPGRQFEKAVYEFVRALQPTAAVEFDHKVADRDTGTPRQVDAWVTVMYGQIPINILVSCKDYRRRVNITQIGTFCDEIRSAGAHTGIIYSRAGFSANALAKAKANHIACCRLYQQEPADMPEVLIIPQFFLCKPRVIFNLISSEGWPGAVRNWGDLLECSLSSTDTGETVMDVIEMVYREAEEQSARGCTRQRRSPENWLREVTVQAPGSPRKARIVLGVKWVFYTSHVEATLVNGSYCFTHPSFVGTQAGPVIDTHEPPGEAWEETEPRTHLPGGNSALVILWGGDFREALKEKMGDRLLPA